MGRADGPEPPGRSLSRPHGRDPRRSRRRRRSGRQPSSTARRGSRKASKRLPSWEGAPRRGMGEVVRTGESRNEGELRAPPAEVGGMRFQSATGGTARRSSGRSQLISVHELVHELLHADAYGAQTITCDAHRCPPEPGMHVVGTQLRIRSPSASPLESRPTPRCVVCRTRKRPSATIPIAILACYLVLKNLPNSRARAS